MHVYLHDPSNKRRLAASVDESYTLRGFYARFPERDAVITVAQQFGPIPGARDELLVLEAYLWPGAAGVGRVVSRWRRDGYRNAWDELRRQVTTSTGLDIGAPERGGRNPNPTADPRPFIAGAEWTFASTMPDNPHHYVVERDFGGPAFDDFVALIQAGESAATGGTTTGRSRSTTSTTGSCGRTTRAGLSIASRVPRRAGTRSRGHSGGPEVTSRPPTGPRGGSVPQGRARAYGRRDRGYRC